MSKRKKGKYFSAPSQVTEKYYQNLKQAASDETAKPTLDIKTKHEVGPTDSSIPNDYSTPTPVAKKWEMPKLAINSAVIITFLLFLFGITKFFWNMNVTLEATKTNIEIVQDKIDRVGENIEDSSKEIIEKHNNINIALARIMERLKGLFDNASLLQKSNSEQLSTEKEKKKNKAFSETIKPSQ